MNVVVVSCHPSERSFVAHLAGVVTGSLRRAGADVTVLDVSAGDAPAAAHRLVLSRAEAVVFVYPTWWSGLPGALKAWVDDVWPEPSGAGRSRPFPRIRRIAAVTTHGSSRLVNRLEGEAGRLLLTRSLPGACHPRCRVTWHAVYGLDRAPDRRRGRFSARVERLGEELVRRR